MSGNITTKVLKVASVLSSLVIVGIIGYSVFTYYSMTHVSSADKERVEKEYNEALADIEASKYEEALTTLKALLEIDPSDVRLYEAIADIYETKHRYDLQLEFLDSVEGNVRDEDSIQKSIGRAYCLKGDYDKCIGVFENLKLGDADSYEKFLYVSAYLKKGDLTNARGQVSGYSLCANDYDAGVVLVRALLSEEDLNAIENMARGCSAVSFSGPYVSRMGEFLSRLSAIKGDNLEGDSLNIRMKTEFANELLYLDFDRAVVSMLSGLESQTQNYWELNYLLGMAYLNLGETSNAQKYVENAVTINPYSYYTWWAKAQYFDASGQGDKVSTAYEKAITLAGDDGGVVLEDYISYLRTSNYDSQAKAKLDELIAFYESLEDTESYIRALYTATEYYNSKGNRQKALEYIDLMQELEQNDLLTSGYNDKFYMLACEIWVSENLYERASVVTVDGANVFRNDVYQKYCKALVMFAQGQEDEAKVIFREVVDMDTEGVVSASAQKYL